MDDQEIPLMTGAMFDGANDSPPPSRHGHLHKSIRKGKDGSKPDLLPRGGGGSPPKSEPELDRAFRCKEKSRMIGAAGSRLEGDVLRSRGNRALRRRRQQVTSADKPQVQLRGGGGSNTGQSKEGFRSSTISPRSYTSGRGIPPGRTKPPKGSTGSYTPEDNWGRDEAAQVDDQWQASNSWTWEPAVESGTAATDGCQDDDSKEKKHRSPNNVSQQIQGSPHAGRRSHGETIQKDTKDDGQTDIIDNAHQNDDCWPSTGQEANQQAAGWDTVENGNGGSVQDFGWNADTDEDKSNHDTMWGQLDTNDNEQHNSWDSAATHDARDGNSGMSNKADMRHDQKANLGAGTRSRSRSAGGSKPLSAKQSQTAHRSPSVVTQITSRSAAKETLSGVPSTKPVKSFLNDSVALWRYPNAAPEGVSDDLAERIASGPGGWSPPPEGNVKIPRSESIMRRAADFNAERAKAQAAQLDAKSTKVHSRATKPTTPQSAGIFKSLWRAAMPAPARRISQMGRSHQRRPFTSVEEKSGVADVASVDDFVHEISPPSPMDYSHRINVPHYMDTADDPYAHFVFHYRDMAAISKLSGVPIHETREDMRDRLASLTKDEVIHLFIEERLAANEATDEKLTMKTSQDSEGYQPNLDSANEKLDEWGGNNSGNGDNTWINGDSGGNGWGPTLDDQNNDNQDRTAGNSSGKNQSMTNQADDAWANSNDKSGGKGDWADGNDQSKNNNDTPWAGDNEAADGGGW